MSKRYCVADRVVGRMYQFPDGGPLDRKMSISIYLSHFYGLNRQWNENIQRILRSTCEW